MNKAKSLKETKYQHETKICSVLFESHIYSFLRLGCLNNSFSPKFSYTKRGS